MLAKAIFERFKFSPRRSVMILVDLEVHEAGT
jgi:hypothetical protein